jgi:hypothetical protein
MNRMNLGPAGGQAWTVVLGVTLFCIAKHRSLDGENDVHEWRSHAYCLVAVVLC